MRPILLSVLVALAGLAAAESRVTHDELGFTIAVPDGFVDYPEGRAQKDILYYWIEDPPASENGRLVLAVSRMGLTIGRDFADSTDLPEGMEPVSFRWKEFDIGGGKTLTEQDSVRIVSYVAAVPLRGEAIRLLVAAPENEFSRAEALMNATLASLEGESNWLTQEQRAEKLGEAVGRGLTWPLAIGVGVLVARWNRRRKAAKAPPARA